MNKDKLKEQILSIRDIGLTNMFDTAGVKSIARKLGYTELVTYLNQETITTLPLLCVAKIFKE